MDPTTERVDPRVTRTRALLKAAFLDLMAEKPFEDITVNDITARATVNRATFYAHFNDKYALVAGLIRGDFARALRERALAPHPDAHVHLTHLFLAVTDHWSELSARCRETY